MPLRVDRRALVDLTPTDQVLFERFGLGASVAPPYDFVHHAFEDHAARRPDDVAVEHLGATITYGELDRQASRLAARLTVSGVSAGDHVGLFVQRSIPMVVGILAVLKAGAAYVPQDVRITPPGHLRHIIDTAATRVILTLDEFADRLDAPPGHAVIAIDDVARWRDTGLVPIPRHDDLAPDATAVVIFTSGTTGTPNGVAVTHRNLANVLLIAPGSLGIRPGMRVSQILNIAFDMAAWELLDAAHAEQRQSRWRAGVAIGAAIAAAAILVLAVVWRVSDADERTMAMVQTVPSAVTAEVTLIGERSGTRIEVACVYGDDPAGATRPFGLFVTDTEGSEALLASWTAEPGSHSWPDATTGLAERDIERIDIRALDTGEVLLEVEP